MNVAHFVAFFLTESFGLEGANFVGDARIRCFNVLISLDCRVASEILWVYDAIPTTSTR